MKKWLKILLGLIGFFLLTTLILRQIYLTDGYVEQPTLKGRLTSTTFQSNNQARNFQWYAPPTIKNKSIVFVLHGSTGTGEGVREQTAYEFDQLADQEGFVVVYPTGYANHWNDCRGSADYEANIKNIDDITFLKEIETYLSENLNTTFENKFATGHSNGGHFCFKLALEAPDWISGIAAISANLPIAENLDCQKRGQFVPLLLINGTKDKVNPYNGGLVSILGNDSRGTVMSTDETMDYWTKLNDCLTKSNPIKLADLNTVDHSNVVQIKWRCENQTQAILYKINGGGHTIPHTKSKMPKILGATNQDIDAAAEIWQFFKTQIQ